MKKVIDKSDSRGHSLYDWLDSHHTFSFDEYYNPRRMNFGALRVLNDDRVAPGKGFGTHPLHSPERETETWGQSSEQPRHHSGRYTNHERRHRHLPQRNERQ